MLPDPATPRRRAAVAHCCRCVGAGLAAVLAVASALAADAAPSMAADKLVACPLSSEEVKSATGLGFRWMAPPSTKPSREDGMPYVNCRGVGEGHNGYFTVVQQWADPKTAGKRFEALRRLEFKGAEAVADDADHALWLARPELKTFTLNYVRGNVLTTLRAMSVEKKDQPGLRERMLKIRRVP